MTTKPRSTVRIVTARSGWHVAVYFMQSPSESGWEIRSQYFPVIGWRFQSDENGATSAHPILAMRGDIPAGPSGWYLRSPHNETLDSTGRPIDIREAVAQTRAATVRDAARRILAVMGERTAISPERLREAAAIEPPHVFDQALAALLEHGKLQALGDPIEQVNRPRPAAVRGAA